MSSYNQNIYQLIFAPKSRKPCLEKNGRERLFKYLVGVLKKNKCISYQINGVENHIHFIFFLHPSIPLSQIVKKLKHAATYYIKENDLFQAFEGWQTGYSAFTYHYNAKDRLIKYVQNQEKHHNKNDYEDELDILFKEHNIVIDERYPLF